MGSIHAPWLPLEIFWALPALLTFSVSSVFLLSLKFSEG